MLEVIDTVGAGHSHSYIGYEFDPDPRNEIRFSTTIEVRDYPIRDILIALLMSEDKAFAGIFLGPDGEIKLQNWHYRHWPEETIYPSQGLYPKGSMRSFPRTTRYPTQEYPNIGDPPEKTVLKNSRGPVFIDLLVRGLRTYMGETDLYAEKTNDIGKTVSGNAYGTMLNWKNMNPIYFIFGAVTAQDTTYNIAYTDMKLEGELFEGEWFSVSGYDGLKLDTLDSSSRWQGARRVGDPATYSENTHLQNLARYDYARPDRPLQGTPKGLRWKLPPGG